MAPTRKKSVNQRFLNEALPHKEVRNSNKNKDRVAGTKRKFSDKLGPRWSEGELQRFYKAYRAHGMDGRKIAAEVPNRSVGMVEALFMMNKAYLSLPEGTASVFGLIAMMTDHYNTLDMSESDRESNDASEVYQKALKRKRAKLNPSKEDLLQSNSLAPNDGYLSLLKKGNFHGGRSFPVRKRTPRVPVSYPCKKNDREDYISPKKGQKSGKGANDDEVAHGAALTLTKVLQRGGSTQVSYAEHGRREETKSSPVLSWERMPKSSYQTKHRDASIDEEWIEDGVVSRDNGVYSKDTNSLVDMEGVGTVEVVKKGKKFYGKKVKAEEFGNSHSDDSGEACSGTERGPKLNAKIDDTFLQTQNKRSDKLFSGDEFSALDALQALANISVMESESSVHLNEERTALDKSRIPGATSTGHHHRDQKKLLRRKEKVLHSSGEVHGTSRKSKLGRQLPACAIPFSEAKQVPPSIDNNGNALKRKRQSLASKVPKSEAPIKLRLNKPSETEIVDDEEIISSLKGKRTGQTCALTKQSKKANGLSERSLGGDTKTSASDLALSTAEVPDPNQAILPSRRINKRKMGPRRAFIHKEGNSSENVLKTQTSRSSTFLQDKEHCLKKLQQKLSCCLSSPMVQRWCTFEWFYSAVDYPWFAKREFVEYLNHVGLGHIPRLTRVEWGVIRGSLGKPRRFSSHFLHEERDKLKQYRDSVRKHYTELRTGVREGLPTDLARPLSVGQRVIVLHPKTRKLCDGHVLTIDHDRCRVQFDSPEMGVEFVKDIDCMPSNPFDNMPFSLSKELQANRYSDTGGFATSGHLENSPTPNTLAKPVQVDPNFPQAKIETLDAVNAQQIVYGNPSAATQVQAKEADIQALSELNRAHDKTANLRQHNTSPGNCIPPWLKSPANSSFPGGLPSCHDSFVSQESGSTVVEIVGRSRHKAHTMVDAAVQAFASLKEGEDAFVKIGDVLDSIDKQQLALESKSQVIRSPEKLNGIPNHQNQSFSKPFDPSVYCSTTLDPKSQDNSEKVDSSAIPSELIKSCVATMLMIQTCTERQYPPAEVAQIIDSAVKSLQPCSPQNLQLYTDIQTYMGKIKTQILALIPTT